MNQNTCNPNYRLWFLRKLGEKDRTGQDRTGQDRTGQDRGGNSWGLILIKNILHQNLCTCLYQNCPLKHVNKNGARRRFDKKEDVSSYWITLRRKEGTGTWKRKHYIVLCGESVLEEVLDLAHETDTLFTETAYTELHSQHPPDIQFRHWPIVSNCPAITWSYCTTSRFTCSVLYR